MVKIVSILDITVSLAVKAEPLQPHLGFVYIAVIPMSRIGVPWRCRHIECVWSLIIRVVGVIYIVPLVDTRGTTGR